MTEPVHIGAVIPDTLTELRKRVDEWNALTPQEQAERLAKWDAEAEIERQDELARRRKWKPEATPARFANAIITHPQAQAWVEAVCEDPHYRGLLIQGPTGVGKTHLLWGIYHELADREGPRMEVVKLVRLLASLRPGGDGTQDALDALCRVPVLAIDDIGTHQTSPWVEERLYEIIDARYDAMLPIVATTNRKTLEGKVAEQVISRLEELCEPLVIVGPDRRRT